MTNERVQLTREQLYELVWSRPIHQLAAEFGLSDVGLAKVCKRLNIPRPPRGHWRKIESGKKSPRVKLPAPKPHTPTVVDFVPRPPIEPKPKRDVPDVPIPSDLRSAHEVTSRLSKLFEGRAVGEPPMHRLRRQYGTVIRLSPDSKRRGLLILDALFKAVASRGHQVRLIERHEHHYRAAEVELCILVGAEEVPIALIERSGQSDHVLTQKERDDEKRYRMSWAPKYDRFATGKLQLEVGLHYGTQRGFRDSSTQRVEDKLGRAVLAVEAAAEVQRAKHESDRLAAARAKAEEERQEAQREQQEYTEALGKDLLKMAHHWTDAAHLRAFLDAYEARLPEADRTTGEAAWLAWARRFANERDPLLRPKGVAKRLSAGSA